jgi:hypothetical protein
MHGVCDRARANMRSPCRIAARDKPIDRPAAPKIELKLKSFCVAKPAQKLGWPTRA